MGVEFLSQVLKAFFDNIFKVKLSNWLMTGGEPMSMRMHNNLMPVKSDTSRTRALQVALLQKLRNSHAELIAKIVFKFVTRQFASYFARTS